MTFKYTEIACYAPTLDGDIPVVCHDREAESLEAAAETLESVMAADINIKYVLIRKQGDQYPCWDSRNGRIVEAVPPTVEPVTSDEPTEPVA